MIGRVRRHDAALIGVIVALTALFTLASEDGVFLSVANAQSMAVNATQLLLLAVGLVLLLCAGEFDLSLGANLVLSSVVAAIVARGLSGGEAASLSGAYADELAAVALAAVAAVVCGAAVGAVNGLVVTRLRVNSLIATLGMMGAAQGLALLLTDGADIGGLTPALQDRFGLAELGGLPVPAVAAALVALIAWAVLAWTRFGLRTIAIGSSRSAARRADIDVRRHVLILFVVAGALCGLAGFVDVARFASTAVSGHQLDPLTALAAVLIGGTALSGGRASVPGAALGAILLVVLQSGLLLVGLETFWQLIAVGVTLVAAVALQQLRLGRDA